jgi:hypothetical protein
MRSGSWQTRTPCVEYLTIDYRVLEERASTVTSVKKDSSVRALTSAMMLDETVTRWNDLGQGCSIPTIGTVL